MDSGDQDDAHRHGDLLEKVSQATAEELKALGNQAYQRKELETAVDMWHQALRKHVEEMEQGDGPSPLSEECAALERSLYLNLAQGYLKLGVPERALKACHVVLMGNATDPKAHYRAAEACILMNRLDEAESFLTKLLESDIDHVEAAKLLNKVRHQRRAEKDKQRQIAKRMCAGATGFSDDRSTAGATLGLAQRLAPIPAPEGHRVAQGLAIGELAAKAARDREARRATPAEETALPQPSVVDLDAFRAKATARSQKYAAFVNKSRQKQDMAQRSVKLAWLRQGHNSAGLASFTEPLREELREIEAQDSARATLDEEQRDEESRLAEVANSVHAAASEVGPACEQNNTAGGASELAMGEMD